MTAREVVALIRKKLQRYRDRKRYEAFLAARRMLRDRQEAQRVALILSHQLQACELDRQIRALAQVEQRERENLETALIRERRERINGRYAHMPPMSPAIPIRALNATMLNSWPLGSTPMTGLPWTYP